jgi:hypothetical protein
LWMQASLKNGATGESEAVECQSNRRDSALQCRAC